MKQIEHDALMETLERRKRKLLLMIAALVVLFAIYLAFVRPLLQAYI